MFTWEQASHQNILNSSRVKDFLNWSSAANSTVHGWIQPNFKLIRDYTIVLVTCKTEEDPIKSEGTRVPTSLVQFLTPKSVVEFRRNLNSGKLLWLSLLPARMKIQSKIKALECLQDFPHYKSMGIFFKCSRAANSAVCGRIVQHFELVRDIIVVPLTCKNKEDQIKNKQIQRIYVPRQDFF